MKLKRISILFTVMLILSTVFTSFAFADEKLDKPNLVALGDSITFGWNLGDTEGNTKKSANAFPNLIVGGAFNVTNISGGGWTSKNILDEVNDPENATAIENAHVFTLDIGSNDLMQAIGLGEIIKNGTPVNPAKLLPKVQAASLQLGNNLQAIFTKVRSLNTTAPIILYNLYNPFASVEVPVLTAEASVAANNVQFYAFLHDVGEQIVTAVNSQIITPFASVPGTFIADAYTSFDGNQLNYVIPGDIHPNVSGQTALAKLATDIILSFPPVETITEIELIATPTEETTGSVIIEVKTNAEEVLLMKWLPGEKEIVDFANDAGTIINDNKFEVTENGTYTVFVLDNKEVATVKSIKIENIKEQEKPPVENPEPKPEPTTPEPKPATPKPTPTTPVKGNPLPNTASPVYNYLAIGSTLVLAGFVVMTVQNRRRKEEV
jgi:lysophospholipase L1-like esterase